MVLPEGEKDSDGFVSTGIYPKEFDSALRRVFSLNRNLVGNQKGATPTISLVPYKDTEDMGNAFASSDGRGYLGFTDFSSAYIGTGIPDAEKNTPVAKIGINVLGTSADGGEGMWTMEPQPSLPQSPKEDIFSVMFHELFHAYGLNADVGQVLNDEEKGSYTRFDNKENFSIYSSGLRDYFGTAAAPGMEIKTFNLEQVPSVEERKDAFWIGVQYEKGTDVASAGKGL